MSRLSAGERAIKKGVEDRLDELQRQREVLLVQIGAMNGAIAELSSLLQGFTSGGSNGSRPVRSVAQLSSGGAASADPQNGSDPS